MDELYKLLVNFTFGEPITKKRLLRMQDISVELIQKALNEGVLLKQRLLILVKCDI